MHIKKENNNKQTTTSKQQQANNNKQATTSKQQQARSLKMRVLFSDNYVGLGNTNIRITPFGGFTIIDNNPMSPAVLKYLQTTDDGKGGVFHDFDFSLPVIYKTNQVISITPENFPKYNIIYNYWPSGAMTTMLVDVFLSNSNTLMLSPNSNRTKIVNIYIFSDLKNRTVSLILSGDLKNGQFISRELAQNITSMVFNDFK
jgi:hypothetical protein